MKKLVVCTFLLAILLLLGLRALRLPVPSRVDNPDEAPVATRPEAPEQRLTVAIAVEQEKPSPPSPIPTVQEPEETDSGEFPPIWANYKRRLGFEQYAQRMERLGAVFLVWLPAEKAFSRIDRSHHQLVTFDLSRIGPEFSPCLRTIEDETRLLAYLKSFDCTDAEVFLALPNSVEQKIQSEIRNWLAEKGIPLGTVAGIRAYYTLNNGQFVLNAEEVALKSGDPVSSALAIPLG